MHTFLLMMAWGTWFSVFLVRCYDDLSCENLTDISADNTNRHSSTKLTHYFNTLKRIP